MKKVLTFIVTALTLFFILPVINPVRAACSISNISVEIPQSGPNIKVNNEDPAITGSIYVSASGSCSPSANTQYFFRLRYLDEFVGYWRTQQSTLWQNSNNADFGLNSGIRYYAVYAWITNGTDKAEAHSTFYKMEKTSSSIHTISQQPAYLSWSLRMNYYAQTSPSSQFPFYLLVGTDPAILTNRQSTTGEIPVSGIAKDTDTTEWRITWYRDNYFIGGKLQPNTTYYWRVRGDHPLINDSYFAGGTFKTLPLLPTVTTLDITNLTTPSSVTLNGQVNPNEDATTAWFRYSTSHPGACNDLFGTRVPVTDGVDVGSGTTAVHYSQTISLPNQSTYYYCAIAQNAGGTSFGDVQSFRNSNRVFILPNSIKGGWIGGLTGADAKCQDFANIDKLGGSWKAWLSNSQTSAASHLAHFDFPYSLVDGTTIANNWADLTTKNLLQKINKTSAGKLVDGILIWTNTNPDGSINSTTDTCSDWTNTADNSNLGHNGFTDGQWTKWEPGACSDSAPFYCFEQSFVTKLKPDLVTSGLQLASGTLNAGSNVTFKATVKNSGSAAVMESFFNHFSIDFNSSTFNNADFALTPDSQVIPLSSGVALDVNSAVTIESAAWSGIPPGTHTVQVCADSSNNIEEYNNLNNCTTTTFTVSGSTCTGTFSLSLDPSHTAGGGSVVPTASGLSGCSGKIINFNGGGVNVGSCQSGSTGCSGQAFTAPGSIGTYQYIAFIDKNGNGHTADIGEQASAFLTVTSALPPSGGGEITPALSGGGSPPTSVSTCGADNLKILEGLLTSPPKQGQIVSPATDPSTKCIIDPKAAFAPFKIPTFEDLKSLYYTQK